MATLADTITTLTAQVAANTSAEKSALALINGFSARLQSAIDAATAAGATAAQLQQISDLSAAIKDSRVIALGGMHQNSQKSACSPLP